MCSRSKPLEVLLCLFDVHSDASFICLLTDILLLCSDCYVAVTGLPDPRKDHAVAMVRFAAECLQKMNDLAKQLEVSLGPDTGDLSMRFGLHSGPVTAGVLRGDKSRFQLFGDTVNLASKIESTGQRNRIHLSHDTAELLIAAGKDHWVEARENKVEIKSRGEVLQTYWLALSLQSAASTNSRSSDNSRRSRPETALTEREHCDRGHSGNEEVMIAQTRDDEIQRDFNEKMDRLVTWNIAVLSRLLSFIVARRRASESHQYARRDSGIPLNENIKKKEGETVLDEVKEIIRLPNFDKRAVRLQVDPETIDLGEEVINQLRDYVTIIATMYNDNPFHNFEHASHVTMSVVKLLSRIVAPEREMGESDDPLRRAIHDHTYGITSDPLTQFACVFSALIHDVDHFGVPNTQLVKEGVPIAAVYKNKSVAEQNSVDIGWDLLMDIRYSDLRQAIYANYEEQRRFRQLVVNSVMATDIVDEELKTLRNARWEKAFQVLRPKESLKDSVDRKATIVIEHLIQASDIAHTMQHWHVFRKWNERLYHEMYKAYKTGRSERDPTEFWYCGEIRFFDFYVIPLAKKLKDCGVFGVSSDEYLSYALKNRKEWEDQGAEIVAAMAEKYHQQYIDHEARLDDIQDEEHPPLRSDLLNTEHDSEPAESVRTPPTPAPSRESTAAVEPFKALGPSKPHAASSGEGSPPVSQSSPKPKCVANFCFL